MEDFKQKARLVSGGYMTEILATITYASVVSRETVRIALMIAALNDLEVKSDVIFRALYGLKSAGAAFRSHLAMCMESLGHQSCKAAPDLWLKP